MKRNASMIALACLLAAGPGTAMACKFTAGETKFADYANCRYGGDAVLVVDLPEGNSWEQCVYRLQAFRPEELLAVTREENGKETLSINDRSQIGNPCYLTKRSCDAALKALKDSGAY